ncbi:MAG: AAA family ATPase [Candidatus Omnitrophica bacterium]|nr:AAA family ATPase [Candidatus Omnitrophota bacterium]
MMYLDFYGFVENPFNITSDPSFLYLSQTHKNAFDHLLFGINERKGFILLTGEIGAGKTTLCKALLYHLPQTTKTSFVFNSNLPEGQLFEAILGDFGILPKRRNKISFLKQLNSFLLHELSLGNNAALIIDEAQNLRASTLEFIRMLSNFETEKEKLIQIVLSGQPELRDKLEAANLSQLKQRISVRSHLSALTVSDVGQYIDYRIWKAQPSKSVVFTPDAVDLIYTYSGGIPRLINIACDKALLCGFVLDTTVIDHAVAQRSIEELSGISHPAMV